MSAVNLTIIEHRRASVGSVECGEARDSGASAWGLCLAIRTAPEGVDRVAAHRRRLAVVCVVIWVLAVTSVCASAQDGTSNPGTVVVSGSPSGIRAGHVLVKFKQLPSQAVLNQLNAAFGAKAVGTIAGIGVTHFQAPPEKGLALLENLRRRPDVEFVEFDSIVKAIYEPNDHYYSTPYPSSHYGNIVQWAPPAVSAPAAWDVTFGSSTIVIAVVDTGVDNSHPDLASKIVGEYSFVGSVKDGFGHGTHVAGIAAAITNNGIGIAGLCPNCSILSVKVLNDQGSGYTSDVASGITYAASHGARVINLSLGGNGRTQTLDSALQYALANNALPVCAMGNNDNGSSTATPEPAYWYSCLSVIATDETNGKASFSNFGIKADVSAPGVAVLSTMPTYPVVLNNYGYYENYDALSGTSMATPIVAGIAGLVLSENPGLTANEVKGIIEATAGDGSTWNSTFGFGLVNAQKAVAASLHSSYAAPTPNLLLPTEGATVSKLTTVQAAPTGASTVHHVDIVQNDSRLMQPLVGVLTSSGSGKHTTTIPAWTIYWPSTVLFNGAVTISAVAVDAFGNTSSPQMRDFSVLNTLVTYSGSANLCWPATTACPSTIWLPVTTGVATEAATHLQGTVVYTSQQNIKASDFWLQVSSSSNAYYCGTPGTSVDCYPPITLEPDGTKSYSNYSGGQIDAIARKPGTEREAGQVQWTLTYPQ